MAVSRYHLAAGVLGFTLGLSLSSLLSSTTTSLSLAHLQYQLEQYQIPPTPPRPLPDRGDHLHLEASVGPSSPVIFHDDPRVHQGEEQGGLAGRVRVLCWIMTGPANHKTKAVHVKATWGRRCNSLLFMSSQEDEELGSVALGVPEGHDNLWAKTREAFR